MGLKRIMFLTAIFAAAISFAADNKIMTDRFFRPAIPGKNPKSYWWPRTDNMSFKDGILELKAGEKESQNCGFKVNVKDEIATAVKVSLAGRVEDGEGLCRLSYTNSKGWMGEKSIKLTSSEWASKTIESSLPQSATTVNVSFNIKGKNAKLFIKDVSMTLLNSSRIKIKDGDKFVECSGIYIIKSKPYHEFYDKKAAKVLSKFFHKLTDESIPVKYLSDPKKEACPGMILVGEAAKQSGIIPLSVLKSLKSAGYAVKVDKGIVALSGESPSGVMSGAYALLEKVLNVTFVNEEETEPKLVKRAEIAFAPMQFAKSPAFELRLIRDGNALKYTDPDYIGDARIVGCKSSTTCHTAEGLVEFDKYHKEHPEYFALGKDGKRLQRDPNSMRFDVHFCMSNKEVQKLIAEQIIAWMTANPQAKYFYLTPGDGGGQYCRCADCMAMDEKPGVISDRNIKFVNAIADIVIEKFPTKLLMTLAYVDLEQPPVKAKPAQNVRVLYCPYPRNWSNHLEAFDKEYNAEGIKTLNAWLKICAKNIYIFCYPSCCGEAMNIWPAFYANYEKIMFYAKHNLKGIIFCGLGGQRNGFPGHNSFNAMSRFVLSKVLWNPKINVEKEIDRFMKLYYGPAAPYMREFFNLIHKEVKDRHFVQHTEEVKRGFVTKELAEKSYAIFAKAEQAASKDPKYLERVQKEKTYLLFADLSDRCRSNGKIGEKEMPAYAKRLAEFAQLCNQLRITYFARKRPPQQWYWETALLKIKDSHLSRSKKIKELIDNPLETLGESIPRCQAKIKNGWQIPTEGIAGGICIESYSYNCPLKNNVKLLRRPSSGYGYMVTHLYLDSPQKEPMRLELEGMDNDKEGKALMEILINGKTIFSGKAPFTKNKWSCDTFEIPSGILQKGKNIVEFKNITPDVVTKEEKKNVDFIVGRKKNYYWGWYIISGMKVIR